MRNRSQHHYKLMEVAVALAAAGQSALDMSMPRFGRGRVLCPSHFKGEPVDYIPAWRGDGVKPPETRQQRRFAARAARK